MTKEPQQVTNPNNVKAGKRLAEYNCRKREEKKAQSEASELNQYYGIGAVLAVGVIGGLDYYIYRTKKSPASREVKDVSMPGNPTASQPSPRPQTNKFEMDYISSVL